jgi:hypothetical protein
VAIARSVISVAQGNRSERHSDRGKLDQAGSISPSDAKNVNIRDVAIVAAGTKAHRTCAWIILG